MASLSKISIVLFFTLSLCSCIGQNQASFPEDEKLSDDFDQSPPFAYKMPEHFSPTDTSSGWKLDGQKILLTGTVFQIDGKTPASNVLLYYYQTDINGLYTTKPDEPFNMPKNKLGQTHGYIRGWVKTGQDGKYAIYTVMPGTYPSRGEPAHIHMFVKESNINEPYYIDDFVFDHDPLLTTERRNSMENRCGSGVIRFIEQDDLWVGERNLFLGLNIPDYTGAVLNGVTSGKNIGEDLNSFTPFHAYGPDKGTATCPICKYGWYHGVLYFVGNKPNWTEIKKWLSFLDNESQKRAPYLKVYFVYGNEKDYSKENRESILEELGEALKLKTVALTFVPAFSDNTSDIYLNKIDQHIENTFILYKRSNIIGKHTNLKPTEDNFSKLQDQLDQSENEYFKHSRVKNE